MDLTVVCPKCGAEVPLTETLAAPLVAAIKNDYEQRIAKQEEDIRAREGALEQASASIEQRVVEIVKDKEEKLRESIEAKAKASNEFLLKQKQQELVDAREQIRQREEKLAEAQAAQAEAVRKERELEDRARALDLEIEKRVSSMVSDLRLKARIEADEEARLKVAEKEEQIRSMQTKIEELKRKAEQGSQQLQGEVQELILEELLSSAFKLDLLEPVAKGVHGGDVVQKVLTPGGGGYSTILWESKRTKNWSPGWLPKLRNDQRAAGADVAILVSEALPPDVELFDFIDGVWVCHPRVALPVATMVRVALGEIAAARSAGEGQKTKMELVYQYLTGPQFRLRIEALVEAFVTMKDDLEKEKRALTKQWSKREQLLERSMVATTGLFGDLQGISGQSLAEIQGLSLGALTAGAAEAGEE